MLIAGFPWLCPKFCGTPSARTRGHLHSTAETPTHCFQTGVSSQQFAFSAFLWCPQLPETAALPLMSQTKAVQWRLLKDLPELHGKNWEGGKKLVFSFLSFLIPSLRFREKIPNPPCPIPSVSDLDLHVSQGRLIIWWGLKPQRQPS